MKIPALVTAIALACGGAYAQSDGAAAGPNTNDKAITTQSASTGSTTAGEPVTQKIKRGAHKVADATRRMGHRISAGLNRATHKKDTSHASKDDARSMGAAPAEDSGRRSRMDQAYSNWKNKQK